MRNIKNSYIVMIEEFKNCLPKDVKTHIDEEKVETIYKLTMLADKYGVTHRSKTKPSYPYNLGTQTPIRLRNMNYERGGSNHSQGRNLQLTNNNQLVNGCEIKPWHVITVKKDSTQRRKMLDPAEEGVQSLSAK